MLMVIANLYNEHKLNMCIYELLSCEVKTELEESISKT